MIMSSSPPSILKNDIETNTNFPFIQKTGYIKHSKYCRGLVASFYNSKQSGQK